jgi:REP-associated tyrosine transposase
MAGSAMTDRLMDISRSPHRPLHWYAVGRYCFVTAATLHHLPHLRVDRRKEEFIVRLLAAAEDYRVEAIAWTVMEHHYHAIFLPQEGRALAPFLGRLHSRTSAQINREDGEIGRQIWRQYWDRFLWAEGDFWSRINYILWNPVKHGFCARPEEWPWTNLGPLMAGADETARAALTCFPAPRKLPGDLE